MALALVITVAAVAYLLFRTVWQESERPITFELFAGLAIKDAIDHDGIDLLLVALSPMSMYIRQDLLQNSPRDMDNLETIRDAILKSNKNLDIK